MTAAAAAGRPPRRGPTLKQAQRPITSYDADSGQARHRKIGAAEARARARALPEDTDPDTVEHPQVRQALIDRFVELEREDEERREGGGQVIDFPAPPAAQEPVEASRSRASSAGNRTVTTVAGHSVSLAQLPLGLLAYAALVNIVNGTFRQWMAAKFTNGGGSLP